jgi:L-histidine N-alpha-methyltransferase
MTNSNTKTFNSTFEKEVYEGLVAFPKYLSSKWFYDKKGDKLFQDIMAMSEYYLTDCEYNILDTHTSAIADQFNSDKGFDLIELGAGDGKKTKLLLKHLSDQNINFDYLPIDISQNALDQLEESLAKELPKVSVKTQQGTYFEVLEKVSEYNKRKKVILFLGSNIGNLLHEQAIDFLTKVNDVMSGEDMLFMGFDQKKHPQIILDAYNDKAGITEAFNKNILHRINKELNADFNVDEFLHWEVYDPESGSAKSYLVSKKEQTVHIKSLDITVSFDAWESIHTEISQKYTDAVVEWLAEESGLKVVTNFADENTYYKNYIFNSN